MIKSPSAWRILRVGGRANMGPALHAMFLPDSSKCVHLTSRGHTPEQISAQGEIWRKKLRMKITNFQGEVCIISGESMTDAAFCDQSVAALRDFLKPLFDEVTVIGYVRPPCQYKNSRFQERIKHSHQQRFYPEKIGYRDKIEKFDKVFGRSNVKLRKFNPANFSNNCAVADFCQQIGIQLPQGFKVQRLNESLSRGACGMLQAYRKFGAGFGAGKSVIAANLRLIRVLQMMSGEKLAFSASILHAALEHEKMDVQWMEQRLGVSLDENYSDKGGELDSEEELLMISHSSVLEFVHCFEKTYNLCVMPSLYPQGDPVNPADVALFLESCCEIIRQSMSQKGGPRPKTARQKLPKVARQKPSVVSRLKKIPLMLQKNCLKFLGLSS